MLYHARAESFGSSKSRGEGLIGYLFNATAQDFESIRQALSQGRDALIGGVTVNAMNLRMVWATLQIVETPEAVQRTDDSGGDWARVSISGRDATPMLRPRTPHDVERDEQKGQEHLARPDPTTKEVFVVHGHDHEAMHSVARLVQQLGLKPIILVEQSNGSQTVIEKLESHASAAFAVVLLTPDDAGRSMKDDASGERPRARQNVVFELGFFVGRLGRSRVCALVKGDIEIPSDWQGVLLHRLAEKSDWRLSLAKEMKAAGFEVDLNLL
jgi:predicted nucleotide-binding protein